jgi:hypothetical protein
MVFSDDDATPPTPAGPPPKPTKAKLKVVK